MALITAQEIKTNTSMGGNVDPDRFMHLLEDCQNLILEPILGTALFDVIVAGSLAGNYATLLSDYIKPVLWNSVYASYLRDSVIIAANGGVFSHQPEGGSVAEIDAIKYVAKSAQSKADVYIERMTRFLCTVTDISEYEDPQTNDYDISPDKDFTTIGGWFLGTSSPSERSINSSGGQDYLELDS